MRGVFVGQFAAGLFMVAPGVSAQQAEPTAQAAPAEPAPATPSAPIEPAASPAAAPKPPAARVRTPRPAMPEAPDKPTAVIGVLDKRLGTTAEYRLTPGQTFTFGRLSGRMRNCETTQPFERRQSAAFLQVAEQPPHLEGQRPKKPVMRFSGWLFAESPSLNPFVHPVYDVWVKSCAMRFPDGPPIPRASGGRTTPGSKSKGRPESSSGEG